MELFLTLLSGISWMIVYEECIRIGLTKKTFCMPLFALALNLAWESIYSILGIAQGDFGAQTIVNAIWFLLDVIIVYTYFKNGKKEFGNHTDFEFYAWTILVIVSSYALQLVFIAEFGQLQAMRYSAYLQNVVMSVMFIGLLEKRQSSEGQSLLLAVAKWIGTLAPVGFAIMEFQPLVLVCGIICSVFDILYICLLRKRQIAKRA